MRLLLAFLFMVLPVFSYSVKTTQAEEDRFREWYHNKSGIEYYGEDDSITPEFVLECAEKAIKTRTDTIADIEAGRASEEGISRNYLMIATIYEVVFKNLSEWNRYESLIYDIEKEKEIRELKDLKRDYPNCRIIQNDLDNLDEVFSGGRIERHFSITAKKEFVDKALPYLYVLELERATWIMAKKAAEQSNDNITLQISEMAIDDINEISNLIKSIRGD